MWDLKGRHFNFDFLLENLVDSFKARGKSCLRTIFTFNSLWGSLERAQKPNSSWFEVQHHPRSSDFAIYSISSTKLLNLKYSLIKNIKSMIKKNSTEKVLRKNPQKTFEFCGVVLHLIYSIKQNMWIALCQFFLSDYLSLHNFHCLTKNKGISLTPR